MRTVNLRVASGEKAKYFEAGMDSVEGMDLRTAKICEEAMGLMAGPYSRCNYGN